MKPNDIIYWNQYSGLTELCTNSDMKHAKQVVVYNQVFYTSYLVEKLMLDEKNEFSIKDNNFFHSKSFLTYRFRK